jgi:predicted transcriptional regulator
MDRPSGGSEEQRCLKNQEKRSLRNTDLMEDEVTGCTPKESIENPVNRLSKS